MFHNEFDIDLTKPDCIYKCNTCGKSFSANYKGRLARLLKKVKCPFCGSRDVEFSILNRIIKKDPLPK